MNIRAVRSRAIRLFEEAGIPDPRYDAEWLLAQVTGRTPMELRLYGDEAVPEEQLGAFEVLVQRRLKREPLQYLLGSAWFFGHEFKADRRALIPRPETEMLVERALDLLPENSEGPLLDLCCGTGCIAVSVQLARPSCRTDACDLSGEALALARENAARLLADVSFYQGDLLEAVGDRCYRLILSNPPYIPSAECKEIQEEVRWEPLSALDGGADGLAFYRRIAREAPAHLLSGGYLLTEVGWQEGVPVAELLSGAGFTDIRIHQDFQKLDRMVEGKWTAAF